MQIICPNCRTSYGVTATALGPNGRNVRCAKCKEVWWATPGDAILAHALASAQADGGDALPPPPAAGESTIASGDWTMEEAPVVESPSIVNDPIGTSSAEATASAQVIIDHPAAADRIRSRGFGRGAVARRRLRVGLPAAILAMAAMALGLIVWRAEIVRMLPQTASFFKLVGLKVNLRHLTFDHVTISSENADGAQVLVIDGFITATGTKPVEVPRLRFIVRDGQGAPLYSWNAVIEQAVLQPGERAAFKSRLASPPQNAHELLVRFFNKRDLATGGA